MQTIYGNMAQCFNLLLSSNNNPNQLVAKQHDNEGGQTSSYSQNDQMSSFHINTNPSENNSMSEVVPGIQNYTAPPSSATVETSAAPTVPTVKEEPAFRSPSSIKPNYYIQKYIRSLHSFQVLAEFPLVALLLFQYYPRFMGNIPNMIPNMIGLLSMNMVLYPVAADESHSGMTNDEFLLLSKRKVAFFTAQVWE